MRILVPYTKLRRETVAALNATGYGDRVEYRNVRGRVDKYWDLFFELWADGQTFCLVEHDMVVNRSTLRRLESCLGLVRGRAQTVRMW